MQSNYRNRSRAFRARGFAALCAALALAAAGGALAAPTETVCCTPLAAETGLVPQPA
jgi:hypothetical protein